MPQTSPTVTNEDLMLAAKVLEIAHLIAESKRSAFVKSINHDLENRDHLINEWLNENTSVSFVPMAYAVLSEVAQKIEEIRQSAD